MAKPMVTIETTGSFKKTEGFLGRIQRMNIRRRLEHYGELGVEALAAETPVDSGVTAASWRYEIEEDENGISIYWKNSATTDTGIPIVILIQYGHATRNGGYVEANDFISPITRTMFAKMADEIWKEVIGK
jgi:hypothetical protein